MVDGGVNYGIALANGLNIGVNVGVDASRDDELLALRIAAAVVSSRLENSRLQ